MRARYKELDPSAIPFQLQLLGKDNATLWFLTFCQPGTYLCPCTITDSAVVHCRFFISLSEFPLCHGIATTMWSRNGVKSLRTIYTLPDHPLS